MKYYSKETGELAYNSESEYLESQLKTYLEEIEECDLDYYPSFKEWIENDDAWTFDVEDEDREWSDEACERFGELCEKYNGVYEAYCLCDEDGAVIPGTEYRTLEELLKKEPEEDIRKVSLVRQTKSEYIETVRDLDESEFKETTIKAYFWHGSGYNAVIFTNGNRWICFDETFEDIDLYDENAVDLCKERIEAGDFNYFDDMYAEFSPAPGYVGHMGPAVGENFDDEFPADEITYLGIVEE